jgi:hypothetical protein
MTGAITWPAAVLALGIFFMIYFRHEISRLIDRIRSFSKTGFETFDVPEAPKPDENRDPLARFLATLDNPLLRQQEENIDKDLKDRGLTEPVAARKALIRSLAGTHILLVFANVQSVIFASQVEALTYLNSKLEPVAAAELRSFYDRAAQLMPGIYINYTFEAWLGFLESWRLIERTADRVSLSPMGREYLKWRIDTRQTGPFAG